MIETVAEDASRAMFLATHQSVRASRTQVGRDGEPHAANEHDVLAVFESKRSDPLIIPIIGASGSGKSHLVRWLHFHLQTNAKRHVIYVPRERTSLGDVVELILERIPTGEDDAELDREVSELQASLKRAAREMSEMELRRRLVENIAHSVLRLDPNKSPYTSAREAEGWRFLVGSAGLPVLLGDPLYKDALSADGRVIARLAGRITHGRAGDTSGEEPLFDFDDLVIDVDNAGLMNRLAKNAYDRFKRPNERWLAKIACDVLNHTLEDVAQETMGLSDNLGRPRIKTIMIGARRVLARKNMELVLLVEDLAVLHGLQRQLLDALITPRRKDDQAQEHSESEAGELCQIRAAIAVTTGVWEQLTLSLDTLTRRLESWHTPLFNLDVSVETVAEDDGAYEREFVAGYLNAVRLGKEGLDGALTDFDSRTDGAPYRAPSVCVSCPHRDDCHSGFGHVSDRGLYPFNEQAITRFVEVEARKSDGRFDPRRVVQGIRKMLDLAARDLPTARFPDAELRDYFVDAETAMSAGLVGRLTRADGATAPRRRTLLEIWGVRPYGVKNLDPAIHRAFELPLLPDELLTETSEDEAEDTEFERERRRSEDPLPRLLEELEKWGRGEATLGDRFAQHLRDLVFEAVLAQVDWEALSVGRSQELLQEIGTPDASRCVSIDGSRGDSRSGAKGTAVFKVERTERSVRFLRGLLELDRHKSWAFEYGEEGMLVAAEVTAAWVQDVEDRLRSPAGEAGALDSTYFAGMLAITGLILGLEGRPMAPTSLSGAVSLALAQPNLAQSDSHDDHSDEWKNLRKAARGTRGDDKREGTRRAFIRRLGRTQGRGESVVALDIADVLKELRRVSEDWTAPSLPSDVEADEKRWHAAVVGGLESAVKAEVQRLHGWCERVAANIDLDVQAPLDAAAAEVEAVLADIARLGKGPSGPRSDAYVIRAIEAMRGISEDEFRRLFELFSEAPEKASWPERLAWTAHDWTTVTIAVADLIRQADSYFSTIEASIDRGETSGDGTGPLANAAASVAQALEEVKRSLEMSVPQEA
jgi:hypothetical protein